MARSRDIRPEYFVDEKVGQLSFGERLLFIGIWCHSDLRGVFEYSAKQLRVLVFPFDEGLTSDTVQGWLNSLESRGFIFRFEAEKKTWGCVKNWHHQGISGREKQIGTKRPEPPQGKPRSYLGTTQVVPGDNPGRTQVASPSPSPSPSDPSASASAVTCARTTVPAPDPKTIDEMDQIMANDQATNVKVNSEPMQVSWQDWRQTRKLGIARTGEDGDMDAWKALWTRCGEEVMTKMYDAITPTLAPGKRTWYAMALDWINERFEDA
jgi:hypothetical protein